MAICAFLPFRSWRGTALGLLLTLSGCTESTVRTTEGDVNEATAAAEEGVYAAYLATTYSASMCVIRAKTTYNISDSMSLDSVMAMVAPKLEALTEDTVSDFKARNATANPLTSDMELGISYVLLSDAQFTEIVVDGARWTTFYERYPEASGLTEFSRVGFNTNMDHALLYASFGSGELVGSGMYYLLQNSGSTWSIVGSAQAWVS